MQVSKIASAVYNDVMAGLAGYSATPTMSLEQLEDEVVEERLLIIKEYALKNLVPTKDLTMQINCIPVGCESMDKCCGNERYSKKIAHFQIPQTLNESGIASIQYVGSVDKQVPFTIYTSLMYQYHKNRIRTSRRPYVYIDTTPNKNNMYDGWIFNAPMLEVISVIGIFKDPRQVEDYACCLQDLDNYNFIDTEVKKRLTEKKLRYYKQLAVTPSPNNQVAK